MKQLKNNNVVFAKNLNDNYSAFYNSEGVNLINQLINRNVDFSADGGEWAEAYVSATGRKSSVIAGETSAVFSSNKYGVLNESVYVIIEAGGISNVSDFAINNCLIRSVGSGKWVLYCNTGTDAVKRAQIYKTLFYGTNGTNPRASSTYITGITALRTSVSRDVGKKGLYSFISMTTANTSLNKQAQVRYNLSLSNSGNDVSFWGFGSVENIGNSTNFANIQVPTGTNIINITSVATTDHTGTDRESNELNDLVSARLECRVNRNGTGVQNRNARIFILVDGNASGNWALETVINPSNVTVDSEVIDFSNDNGIPLFSEATGFDSVINHTIPSGTFLANMTSAICVLLFDTFDDNAVIEYKLRNVVDNVETNWLPASRIVSFPKLHFEVDRLMVRFGEGVAIRGVCVYASD